ncbi:class I SAM-dependent methyltransferase [Rhodopseudomonas sp. BR0G17]|uniref:class I SAM-dependent DNA methyltransferase n=1 Tax=Rhodopseudomonas sp. BR0G17 TaxID=2269368 RepID=UPI0013DEC4A1|nr:class I SAM-dependent methyltransferase [Rhodopseudomonas sp. BR0G17]NEW96446.1 class I SAM-dependent methyltransferase [Rhodopseudomonas sp. BR0G17]
MEECASFAAPVDPADAYNLAAPYYDDWKWQAIWRVVEEDLVKQAVSSQPRTARVLDVGCGTGFLLDKLTKQFSLEDLVGIDVSSGMLEKAKQRCASRSIKFIHSDFLEQELPTRSFDVVFMFRTASHVQDLRRCFGKVASLLREGGTFAFSDVHSEHPYDCTRLPYQRQKIPVKTWKHKLNDIRSIASEFSIITSKQWVHSIDTIANGLIDERHLPNSLALRGHGPAAPFGCFVLFSVE